MAAVLAWNSLFWGTLLVGVCARSSSAGSATCLTDLEDRYSVSLETVQLVCSCTAAAGFIYLDNRPLHDGDFGCTVFQDGGVDNDTKFHTILDCGAYLSGEFACLCPTDSCTSSLLRKPLL
ncbi:hypothetical protein BV898_00223 [Hypsibius exemplaris]|uniref:Uncharacterized protein n=1 Tax=Hypsibius exemplaris TaxID=2072580 RepID=A0A1W0XF55_HYPEX|nr:hypothetical protein BV898_00223 [Hypsibius exemplaris]